MYLSINLLGLFIRGLFYNPELDKIKENTKLDFLKKEIEKYQRADIWATITALILNLIFFYLLVHFWNIRVVIVAIIIMISRLDGLLWDIKYGKKTNPEEIKKTPWYYISAFLPFVAFIVLYFAFD